MKLIRGVIALGIMYLLIMTAHYFTSIGHEKLAILAILAMAVCTLAAIYLILSFVFDDNDHNL